jgi:hypothetical protein
MRLSIADYYALYEGADAITERYIWKVAPNEPAEIRADRFEKSAYLNIVAKAIDTYMGYVFSNRPKLSELAVLDLESALWKSVFHSTLGGNCLGMVLPEIKEPIIFPWTSVSTDGLGHDEYEVTCVVDGHNAKYRIFRDKIVLTGDNIQGKDWNRVQDQVIEIHWNEKKLSLIRDLAPLAVKILNYDSIADTHAAHSIHYVTDGPELAGEQKKLIPYSHIPRQSNDVPGVSFKSPPTEAMDKVEAKLEKTILRAGKVVGLEREFATEYKVQSGYSQEMQMVSTNAITMMIASANVRAINRLSAAWTKMTKLEGGTIQLEPALTPQAKTELLSQLKLGADTIRTNLAAKTFLKEIAKITLATAPKEELQAVLEDLEKNGGLASLGRPELQFN